MDDLAAKKQAAYEKLIAAQEEYKAISKELAALEAEADIAQRAEAVPDDVKRQILETAGINPTATIGVP